MTTAQNENFGQKVKERHVKYLGFGFDNQLEKKM